VTAIAAGDRDQGRPATATKEGQRPRSATAIRDPPATAIMDRPPATSGRDCERDRAQRPPVATAIGDREWRSRVAIASQT
jgi:hypothetical protein